MRPSTKISWWAMIAALILVCGLPACTSDDAVVSGAGSVTVLLTDKPIDFTGVSAVNVTLSEFALYAADDDGETEYERRMNEDPVTLNLLDFQDGNVTVVAAANVPTGDYRRVRLFIDVAELVRDDDGDPDTPEIVEPIRVPPGKVDIPVPFTVTAGEDTEIVIDFDAALSVHVNDLPGDAPYILRPVLTPVRVSQR